MEIHAQIIETMLFLIAVFLFLIVMFQYSKWYEKWDDKIQDYSYWVIFIVIFALGCVAVFGISYLIYFFI